MNSVISKIKTSSLMFNSQIQKSSVKYIARLPITIPPTPPEKTIYGVPPLQFKAEQSGNFTNYQIYGNGDGSVTNTINLFKKTFEMESGAINDNNGEGIDSNSKIRTKNMIYIDRQHTSEMSFVVSWFCDENKISTPETELKTYYYDLNGNFVGKAAAFGGWGAGDKGRRYEQRTISNSSVSSNNEFYLKFVIRRRKDGVDLDLSTDDIYNIQVETFVRNPSAYMPPVDKINGVGDIVSDSRNLHFCEYKIPVAVGGNNYDIYLEKPLIANGVLSDYIDFAKQKRINIDGTQENISLPQMAFYTGNNSFDVSTLIQPSNVTIKGQIEEITNN